MTIHNYMDDINNIPTISKEAELELLKKYIGTKVLDEEGNIVSQDIKLRNDIVSYNLKLVFKVASSYYRSGIAFADLVSEGNLGLIRATEKFDLEKGVKFGYYAYKWIRARILRYIVNNAHIVKVGTTQAQRKLFFNLAKTRAKANALNTELTDEDVAEMLDVKVEEVREMDQRLSAPVISIDQSSEPKNDRTQSGAALHKLLQDRIDDGEEEETPEVAFEREEFSSRVRAVVDGFMARLTDQQRYVFEHRFLVDEDDQKTFDEIGKDLDELSKQRIQQIDAELRQKFKKHLSHNKIVLWP